MNACDVLGYTVCLMQNTTIIIFALSFLHGCMHCVPIIALISKIIDAL